jgi:hypothetical protein
VWGVSAFAKSHRLGDLLAEFCANAPPKPESIRGKRTRARVDKHRTGPKSVLFEFYDFSSC